MLRSPIFIWTAQQLKNNTLIKSLISLTIFFLTTLSISAQEKDATPLSKPSKSIFELLSGQEVLQMSITTDIHSLLKMKTIDTSAQALLKLTGDHNHTMDWNIKVSLRGKHRRRICDFPPLKFKFKKSDLRAHSLMPYNKLKLVTHCSEKAETKELLLKEYLAYKIFNILTPQSFRVQLVKIKWIDSSNTYDLGEKWAFLIEDEDEVMDRLGSESYEEHGAFHEHMDIENAAILYMFQYMIGNHDWKLANGQNLSLTRQASNKQLIGIPYDFDASVLVGAYYTRIPWKLGGPNKRLYLGSSNDAENKVAIKLFKSKKKEILSEIKSFDHLNRSTRLTVSKYIRSFYTHIGRPLRRPETMQN